MANYSKTADLLINVKTNSRDLSNFNRILLQIDRNIDRINSNPINVRRTGATGVAPTAGGMSSGGLGMGMASLINPATLAAGAIAGVGLAVKNLGQASLKEFGTFEKNMATLENAVGSASQARKEIEMLEKVAENTPFTFNQITESFIKLVNRGFKPTSEEIIKLGDLAASQGKDIDQLSEAILDAETFEFERLKEFGIKASKEGNKITFMFKGQKTQVDKNDKAIRKYLIGLGELNGVQGLMSKQMDTLVGKESNLSDAWDKTKRLIGKELAPTYKEFLGGISNFLREYAPKFIQFFKDTGSNHSFSYINKLCYWF